MRLAFLTHEPFLPPSGGGSAEAPHLVREFVGRGHRLELHCPEFEGMEAVGKEWGIGVHPFRRWEMGRYTRLRTLKYLMYPWALSAQVRRVGCVEGGRGVDLFFAQHTLSAVAAGWARERLGGKLVFNFLDHLTGFMEAWPWMFTRTGLVPALNRYEMSLPRRFRADGVLTVSKPLAERFVRTGYEAGRIEALMYGYDAGVFTPVELDAPDPDPAVVVMHGSFDRHHLGPIARDALAAVHAVRPEVIFRFIGRETPVLMEFCGAMTRRCPGIRLERPGFVSYEAIPGWLRRSTVGMVPYEASEGAHCAFVAKAVEYLGCGIPVVSTSLENLTRHFAGEPAMTFAGFDGGKLGEGLMGWVGRPVEERRRLGRLAAGRVRGELDWGALAGRAVDFAERVVSGRDGEMKGRA